MLSERIKRKIPIYRAVAGDIVSPVRKNVVTQDYIPVSEINIDKVNTQICKKKAVVTGLLVGYDTIVANGEMGEIERSIIESEKINLRDFIIPEIPFLSSSGTRRALLALTTDLQWTLHTDELHEDKQALTLRFELQKGCYATSLLREIIKSNEPKNY
jgi:tRNA pseudouridine13 synthase